MKVVCPVQRMAGRWRSRKRGRLNRCDIMVNLVGYRHSGRSVAFVVEQDDDNDRPAPYLSLINR